MRPWSQEEDEILAALSDFMTSTQIAAVLRIAGYEGRTSSSVRGRRLRLGITDGLEEIDDPIEHIRYKFGDTVADAALAVIGKTDDNSSNIDDKLLKDPLTSSTRAQITREMREIYSMIKSSLNDIASITPKYKRKKPASDMSDSESIVLIVSDTHFGKLVLDREGNPIYNLEIAEHRMDFLTQKVVDIASLIEKASKIDEVVIVLAGDIVDAETVYETQPFHLDAHILQQLDVATRSIWAMAVEFAERWPNVRIITCRGNHGRTSGSEYGNWDNIVYKQLSILGAVTNKPIVVSTSLDNYNTFTVKGHKGLVRHMAPKQDGTAASLAKYGGWYSLHKFDFMISGHWHHFGIGNYNDKILFRNGSLVGSDDLAERMALHDRPRQILFGATRHHCPSFIYPIELDREE